MRASMLSLTGPKFSGPNRHEVRGDIAVIFLERENGDVLECYVSTHRLPEILSLRWCADIINGKPYVKSTGTNKTILIHRFLTGTSKGMDVDHFDDNGLNNVDDNLRVATRSQNTQNKSPYSKNAKSGYRNVGYHRTLKLWIAKITVNGKVIAKSAKTFDEAITLAENLRLKHHPFYHR
jgi:hypothetical protein